MLLKLEGGEQAWIFHGDVFDVTMKHAKWLARLGVTGYDMLILMNRFVNYCSERVFKKGKISLSKKIKHSVKKAVSYIDDFETTAAAIGIDNHYAYVVCGHIHQPQIRTITNAKGSITYLNSGDWIENLTALEYSQGQWSLYQYWQESFEDTESMEEEEPGTDELFRNMVREFGQLKAV